MAEIILHHYPFSPFSEKARKVLAVDQITWRGVTEVAIRRRDPEVGDVVVHFPRAGFRLAPA